MKPTSPAACARCGTSTGLITTRQRNGLPLTACNRCRMIAARLFTEVIPATIRTDAAHERGAI